MTTSWQRHWESIRHSVPPLQWMARDVGWFILRSAVTVVMLSRAGGVWCGGKQRSACFIKHGDDTVSPHALFSWQQSPSAEVSISLWNHKVWQIANSLKNHCHTYTVNRKKNQEQLPPAVLENTAKLYEWKNTLYNCLPRSILSRILGKKTKLN